MQDVRKILKLHYENGMSNRKIAQICSCSKTTIADVLAKALKCHIKWPLPPDMTDRELTRQKRCYKAVAVDRVL